MRVARLWRMKWTAGTALATVFFVMAGCSQDEPASAPHPDGDLYRSDPLFNAQRDAMMCTADDRFVEKSVLDIAYPDSVLNREATYYDRLRSHIYYFDHDGAQPLSPDASFARLAERLQADKDIGLRLTGCTDRAGTEIYNLDLSKRRIDAVADRLQSYGIHPDRLCKIPLGEACPVPERKVEVETFILDHEGLAHGAAGPE